MAKKEEYKIKGIPTKISATSRIAIKIRDNYYTLEASEERSIPDDPDIDMDKEFTDLFDCVNDMIDDQAQSVTQTFAK